MIIRKKLWSIILSVALILATVACPIQAAAESEDGIPIDETNFPDAEFRTVVSEYDRNGDGSLSPIEIELVTSITAGRNITSLKGIEYFSDLEQLYCEYSPIEYLDLSQNTELRHIDCEGTKIKSLDVSNNTKLESLYCTGCNNLVSLDVSKNSLLEFLRCNRTGLTSLDVSKNLLLGRLWCDETGLTSLDVSKNSALRVLRCGTTDITNLDVSKNLHLEELDCSMTGLTSLNVSNNFELKSLSCRGTAISKLNLEQNSALEELVCSDSKLTILDVTNNLKLKYLFCENIEITELDLSQNTELSMFDAEKCPLVSLLFPLDLNYDIFCNDGDKISPYKLTLQPGQDSVDLKTIAPSIQAGKILDLKGCKKQGTVLTGLKAGQTVTYRYDYNGGSINVTIEVSESSGQPVNPEEPLQKPTVSSGEGYTTELLEDGTMVAITVKDGYTLEDVKVNGISKGKVTVISDLKTGDTVDITVSKNETPEPVYDLSDAVVTIPADSYTYTGKYIRPTPTVIYDGKKLKKGVDYTVSYSNHKKIGKGEVTVTGVGEYSGSESLEFKIIPKKVALSSVKSTARKSITVKWKKVPEATGYQVQWRKSSKFSSSLSKKVKGAAVTSTKLKKLSSKKKYYVRVRAYKVVNGTTYYGKWSTVKTTKVK